MPKTLLQIKNFNLGIINSVDDSDVPDGGLVNATNLMCDVPGKIRQMGSDRVHADLSNQISALITPGYGLYAYRSDFRVSDDEAIETKILAFQNNKGVGFYDIEPTQNLLLLGDMDNPMHPAFYYSSVDGGFRVSDGNFDNIGYLEDDFGAVSDAILDTNSHIFVKYLKFINKTWFHEDVTYGSGTGFSASTHGFSTHDFTSTGYSHGLDAFIYPPTVASTLTVLSGSAGATHNLVHQVAVGDNDVATAFTAAHFNAGDQGGANIGVQVTHTNGNGTWIADSAIRFGISFIYEGDQESTISPFLHTGSNTGTPDSSDDYYSLDIKMYASTAGWDPRIKGANLYLVGNSNGDLQDPTRLLEFYFGSSKFDPPEILTSDGDTIKASSITVDDTNQVAFNTAVIKIRHEPAITYEYYNGFSSKADSIAANFQTSVITNRRTYIGGVRRLKFDINTIADSGWQDGQNEYYKQPEITCAEVTPELDTVYVSPVDKFDIFPSDIAYTLSIGSNDGEHIIALHEFADRLLQFKTNKLYIINLSQSAEYLEAEYDYMGIQYPYQVIRTEKGIAWTNSNGCYLYDGEGVVNLIEGKLHKTKTALNDTQVEGWSNFSHNTGMIGYVPISEQIVIFENPEASSEGSAGNAFVYDFQTGSWTKASNILASLPKSNIVTNYDHTCLYATLQRTTIEEISITSVAEESGTDAFWDLINCNAPTIRTDADGSRLKIGTTNITDVFHFNYSDGNSFANILMEEIELKTGNAFILSQPSQGTIRITREATSIDSTYQGALAWDTSGSLGPPTSNAISMESPIFNCKLNNLSGAIDDAGTIMTHYNAFVFNATSTLINGQNKYLTAQYFDHLAGMGISNGLPWNANYTSDTIRDEPRVILNALTSQWDAGESEAIMHFDLHSPAANSNGIWPLTTHDASGSSSVSMQHSEASRVDGTERLGPGETEVANGELVISHTTLFDASIQIPSGIFGSGSSTLYEYGPTAFWIIFPGDYTDSFVPGVTYTIAGVESGASSEKVNALNVSLLLGNVQHTSADALSSDESLGVTSLTFFYNEQPTATKTDNWPYLINWTTFATWTISAATCALVDSSNTGLTADPSFFYITPKRHNVYSVADEISSTYHLGVDGQNGKAYNILSSGDQNANAFTISADFKNQLESIYDNEVSKPFGVISFENINRAKTLYDSDNIIATQLSTAITSTGTTSFILTDTINILVGDFLQFLGTATSISGAEIVKVTSIASGNRSTLTVVRAQLGTSALSSIPATAETAIFRLNAIQQASSTQFRLYGDDYRSILTANTLFKVWTGNDITGGNAWTDPTNWSVVLNSSYVAGANYTVVNIDTVESNANAEVGDSSLDGTDSSSKKL